MVCWSGLYFLSKRELSSRSEILTQEQVREIGIGNEIRDVMKASQPSQQQTGAGGQSGSLFFAGHTGLNIRIITFSGRCYLCALPTLVPVTAHADHLSSLP